MRPTNPLGRCRRRTKPYTRQGGELPSPRINMTTMPSGQPPRSRRRIPPDTRAQLIVVTAPGIPLGSARACADDQPLNNTTAYYRGDCQEAR